MSKSRFKARQRKKSERDLITFASTKRFKDKEQQQEDNSLDQAYEQLAEKLAEAVDEYFELTGEPVSLCVSTALHIAEISEIISSGAGKSRAIIITPSALQAESEHEDELY